MVVSGWLDEQHLVLWEREVNGKQQDFERLKDEDVDYHCDADAEEPEMSGAWRQTRAEWQTAGDSDDTLDEQHDEEHVWDDSQQHLNAVVMAKPQCNQLAPAVESRFHIDGHLDLRCDRWLVVTARGAGHGISVWRQRVLEHCNSIVWETQLPWQHDDPLTDSCVCG